MFKVKRARAPKSEAKARFERVETANPKSRI
jgi:hypothetical protein